MDAITSTHSNRDNSSINYLTDKLEKSLSFEHFARKCRESNKKLSEAGLIETKPMTRATEFESEEDFITAINSYMKHKKCSVRLACQHFGYNRDDYYNAKRKLKL
tara:strand:- start:1203 stop:1517 length:315 start_codon:yes stop_codon:yes gene_type:complete